MATSVDNKRQMLTTIGEGLIDEIDTQWDPDEWKGLKYEWMECLIKKNKLHKLIIKECFISPNLKLRKCLVTKYRECLGELMEIAENECENNMICENSYINVAKELKEELEGEQTIYNTFGDINNINSEILTKSWLKTIRRKWGGNT
jgi:hypothetical protein